MMWGYTDGGSMVWMAIVMILFLGGVIALIAFAIRGSTNGRAAGDPAMETLRRRLASGDISQEDFDKTRKSLQG